MKRGDATVETSEGKAPAYTYNSPEAFGDDLNRQFIPWGLYAQERLRSGHLPLWNPELACGQPLFANHQVGLTNPFILLCYYIFSGMSAITAILLGTFILAGWGMYAYLRVLGLGRGPSLLASVCYQFMLGYIPTLDTLIIEKALFPFLLYAVEMAVRTPAGKGAKWVALAIFLLALVQTSAHAQEAVFISYLLGPYIVFVAGGFDAFPKGKAWRTIGTRIVLAAGIFIPALFLGLIQNLPTLEFYRLSTRPKGFAETLQNATMLESNVSWIQSLMIAFPRLFGDYINQVGFLEHYLLNYGYIGMVTLVASIFSGWIRPNRRQIFFWRIVALIFFVAIISNWFYFTILAKIPLFRITPAKPFSMLFFALIVLAGHGFKFLLNPQPKGTPGNRALGRTSLIILASTLSLGELYLAYQFMPKSQDILDQAYTFLQLLIGGLIASAACIIISILWQYVNRHSETVIKTAGRAIGLATLALLAVILIDLWPMKAHFNPFVKMSDMYFQTPPTDFLVSHLEWKPGDPDGPYRFGRSWKEILPPDTGMMYGLDDFGSYDSNLVGKYAELVDTMEPDILQAAHYIEAPFRRDAFKSKVWNMLGVKYVLAHIGHIYQFEPMDRWRHDYIGDIAIIGNRDALSRMHLVENIHQITDETDMLEKSSQIDPSKEAVIAGDRALPYGMRSTEFAPSVSQPESIAPADPPGTVVITDYQPERVTAHVSLNRPALLCFFDVYYPGWEVTVDSKPSDIERVNYTFKGVFVPPGEHEVAFKYRPASLHQGENGSLIGLVLMLILALPLSNVAGSHRNKASPIDTEKTPAPA